MWEVYAAQPIRIHAHAAIGEAFGFFDANRPISSPFFWVHVHVHHDRVDNTNKNNTKHLHNIALATSRFSFNGAPMQIAAVP